MDVRILNGIDLTRLERDVNDLSATHKPIGGIYMVGGLYHQAVIEGAPSSPYLIVCEVTDVDFAARASSVSSQPLGEAIINRSRIIQAFGAQPIGATVSVDDLSGVGVTGLDVLKADTPEEVKDILDISVTDITDAGTLGAQILQADTLAEVKTLVPYVDQVFRGSFTTAAGELTQLVTVANTMQVITFNTQQIPNAVLGTLNNATGVFTAATDINGLLSVNAQIRRGLAGTTTWTVQVETSPDGLVWTPVSGSSRRITLGAGENNLVRFYDFTVATALPAGTQLRFTQSVSDPTNNTGLVALAAGVGGTTSAGFIFSLYTVK